MSRGRIIDAASLSTVCEPGVFDGKVCSELALQILERLHDSSSGTLRDTIEQMFCFRQIIRFSGTLSSKCVPDRPDFFLHLPFSGSSTSTECLNSYFRAVQLHSERPQTKQTFTRSFPGFFCFSFGRYAWINDHMVKDCSPVPFPVMLDTTQ
jgi:hypothetical protein